MANTQSWQLYQNLYYDIPEEDLRKTASVLEKLRLKSLDLLQLDLSKVQVQILDNQADTTSNYISPLVPGSLESESTGCDKKT